MVEFFLLIKKSIFIFGDMRYELCGFMFGIRFLNGNIFLHSNEVLGSFNVVEMFFLVFSLLMNHMKLNFTKELT